MLRIWIIGGGKFGQRAGAELREKHPDASILIVEKNVATCRVLKHKPFDILCMDGIDYLTSHLNETDTPNWIIPAAPLHVAYQWICRQPALKGHVIHVETPNHILSMLPHPIKGKTGDVYMSLAGFICPDNCLEPEDICTFTKEKRPYNLFEKLMNIDEKGYMSLVVQSRQMVPGVGGYKPEVLLETLLTIRQHPKSKFLLSTACRCHGVMSAFSFS